MKMRVLFSLLFVMAVAGCKAPQKPVINDDTIETSQVNGVTLTHRHAVTPPTEFTPVNAPYRAMYPASLMSRPDFGGKVIRNLETGKTYVVLGQVEHYWMALADEGNEQLIGYVPMRAVIKADQYDAAVRKQAIRPKARKKATCVDVDGNSKACKDSANGTWILN
ncbi:MULTISPECIES: SH3 domain-containing protein [Enterobacter]|uniref:SH3 domain-containing protein n=1 Tax=Enterobacter TaxID=547 RepID=UPI001CBC8D54|nr:MULTISPECIES: SH3 domain-containing protein [Enterobacter]MCK7226650.1 SH3 domain-containing protein [Enterobacter asburiae]UAN39180.1 SH3 domain-containing protein [Enterobacter sp. JBIWA008]UXP25764.1 SH3 domain-containing protein [Enterobacter sp. 155105]